MDRHNLMLRHVEPFEAQKCQHKCEVHYCERDHAAAPFSCYASATHILGGKGEAYCSAHIGLELAQAIYAAKLVAGMRMEVGV